MPKIITKCLPNLKYLSNNSWNSYSSNLSFKQFFKKGYRDMFYKDVPKPINIDYAPSGVGRCSVCRKRIAKGIPRGWYYAKMSLKDNPKIKEIKIKKLLCTKHTLNKLISERVYIKEKVIGIGKDLKKFKRMIKGKKSQKALVASDIVETLDKENKEEGQQEGQLVWDEAGIKRIQ